MQNATRLEDRWELASSVDEVHSLLEKSDRAAAGSGGHLPRRCRNSTRLLVEAGAVCGLRRDGRLIVSVAISRHPTFVPCSDSVSALRPAYLRRLSVDPDAGDPLLGYRAVRHAVQRAWALGHDVLRSEVNPDLKSVVAVLEAVGFRRLGQVAFSDGVPSAQMELLKPHCA